MQKGYDFIIGGGSAGAALAAFSENFSAEVLLLKAGGRDWHPRIIGGGSAGAVLAAFAENSSADVLLLKAGGRDWHPGYHPPATGAVIPVDGGLSIHRL